MAEYINENDFALVIGINNYPLWKAGKFNLGGPVKDAQEFKRWLTDKERGGGLPEDNVELVISADPTDPLNPTPNNVTIDLALDRLTRKMGPAPRRLYLFFSGHGHTKKDDSLNTNLCMATFNEETFLGAAVHFLDILNKTSKCVAPETIIAFLDCCRSTITDAAGIDLTYKCPWTGENQQKGEVKHAIFYGTLNYQLAFESGDEVRGHFTQALMEGLRGRAVSSGRITLKSLGDYLKRRVPEISKNDNHYQKPVTKLDFELLDLDIGPENIEFTEDSETGSKEGDGIRLVVKFTPDRKGEILLKNGEKEIVHQADASSGPWELYLKPGLYVITDANSDKDFIDLEESQLEVNF